MPAAKPSQIILNLPELAQAPPEWGQVRAAFAGQKGVIIQTIWRLLLGKMAAARRLRETDPKLSTEEAKFCDGEASASDEVLCILLALQRGELEKMPAQLRGLFTETAAQKP